MIDVRKLVQELVDDCCKDITPKEILELIKSLEAEMEDLKEGIEASTFLGYTSPENLREVEVQRECIRTVKECYKKTGGVYKLSRDELRAQKYEENLPFFNKIVLMDGIGYDDCMTRVILCDDKKIYVSGNAAKSTVMDDLGSFSKKAFLKDLKNLYLGEWKASYCTKTKSEKWRLEIYYNNGAPMFKSCGNSRTPYNYMPFLALFDKYAKVLIE